MISLLDVNLLIALAWPNHVHHSLAIKWFRRRQREGWATCPMTQSGFLRVSSNRHVFREAKTPREALALLRRIVALPHHHFWPDETSLTEETAFFDPTKLLGHRQVTDAHLLAIALRNNGRMATLDAGVRSIVPSAVQPEQAVLVIKP